MKTNRIINNAKWIIVCKIIQSALQLIVGMLCARYLGPSNYGIINYAASVIAFARPIMRLGLNETLVLELIKDPDHEGEIMGTSLVMNVISSAVCMIGVYTFVSVANKDDSVTIAVCVIYSISLFFSALEMIQYWFQYKLLSKYPSVVMLLAYVFVSTYKIYLLVTQKSIYWFAFANSIDYGIIGISLIIIFLSKAKHLSFSAKRAKCMLHVSKNYIFASLMVVVFQSTDHIMLTTMIGMEENGIYSAAITCATLAQFVYVAIVDSFRPVILSYKKENSPDYEKSVSRLYCILIFLALAQCILFTLLADVIVRVLYGAEYTEAASVLRILCWYFIFSCMGMVRNVWILAEQKQRYLWMINLSSAIANIMLNGILIPIAGACGAALASMLTQFFANCILGFVMKPIRRNNMLLIAGICPSFLIEELKTLLGKFSQQ